MKTNTIFSFTFSLVKKCSPSSLSTGSGDPCQRSVLDLSFSVTATFEVIMYLNGDIFRIVSHI